MQWTDRIRQVKMILVAAAVVIAVASLLVSHFLVRDLSKEERNKMEVWAQALHALNQADEHTDLSLVLSVIEGNNTIPVIVLDVPTTMPTARPTWNSWVSGCRRRGSTSASSMATRPTISWYATTRASC